MEVSRCPDCYELIDEQYAWTSGAVVLINTKACAMANTIKTLDPIGILSIVIAALAYVSDLPSGFLISAVAWPIITMIAIATWFIRFGWFKLGDEDFAAARQAMRVRLFCWLLLAMILSGLVYIALENPIRNFS